MNTFTSALRKCAIMPIRLLIMLPLIALGVSATASAEKLAVTGAKIHTMSSKGVIEQGTLLIENGKIKQVLKGVSVPDGYTEVEATGKVITPGFIGALTNLGLVEVSMSAGANDASVDEHTISSVGAAYDAQFAINTDSTLIEITRLEGFTSAATGLGRTGQLFDGQGAFITLSKTFDSVVKPHAFMHVNLSSGGADKSGGSRAALWVALNQALSEAKYAQKSDLAPTKEWHGMTSRADAAALAQVVSGKVPLLVTANRANDILQVLALKKRFSSLDLVLVSASDGWRVAAQIAEAKVPVILDPEFNLPGQFDQLGATMENAARLHAEKVKISIGIETHNARLAPQHAGNAVANGLPHDVALAALTINPATIYGVDDVLGSLEAGKQADFVIWSGDPLEVTQSAEQVFIEGKAMAMESRQTKLRDRYLNRDPNKPAQYSH